MASNPSSGLPNPSSPAEEREPIGQKKDLGLQIKVATGQVDPFGDLTSNLRARIVGLTVPDITNSAMKALLGLILPNPNPSSGKLGEEKKPRYIKPHLGNPAKAEELARTGLQTDYEPFLKYLEAEAKKELISDPGSPVSQTNGYVAQARFLLGIMKGEPATYFRDLLVESMSTHEITPGVATIGVYCAELIPGFTEFPEIAPLLPQIWVGKIKNDPCNYRNLSDIVLKRCNWPEKDLPEPLLAALAKTMPLFAELGNMLPVLELGIVIGRHDKRRLMDPSTRLAISDARSVCLGQKQFANSEELRNECSRCTNDALPPLTDLEKTSMIQGIQKYLNRIKPNYDFRAAACFAIVDPEYFTRQAARDVLEEWRLQYLSTRETSEELLIAYGKVISQGLPPLNEAELKKIEDLLLGIIEKASPEADFVAYKLMLTIKPDYFDDQDRMKKFVEQREHALAAIDVTGDPDNVFEEIVGLFDNLPPASVKEIGDLIDKCSKSQRPSAPEELITWYSEIGELAGPVLRDPRCRGEIQEARVAVIKNLPANKDRMGDIISVVMDESFLPPLAAEEYMAMAEVLVTRDYDTQELQPMREALELFLDDGVPIDAQRPVLYIFEQYMNDPARKLGNRSHAIIEHLVSELRQALTV